MVQQLGNFEDAPEGAQGDDYEQSDASWRRLQKRHHAMVARMAQQNRN